MLSSPVRAFPTYPSAEIDVETFEQSRFDQYLSNCQRRVNETREGDFGFSRDENFINIKVVRNNRQIDLKIAAISIHYICKENMTEFAFAHPEWTRNHYLEIRGRDVQGANRILGIDIQETSQDNRKHWKSSFLPIFLSDGAGSSVHI